MSNHLLVEAQVNGQIGFRKLYEWEEVGQSEQAWKRGF